MNSRSHTLAAGLCFVAILLVALMSVSPPSIANLLGKTVVDIAIEHDRPLSLIMEVSRNATSAVIEFSSETDEEILLSVPSTWVRREVKNAPIHTVTAEPPSLNFTRWTVPPRAGVSFNVFDAPDSLILHNPTSVQMKIDLTYVHVESESIEHEVVLLQDDTVKLW